MDSDFKTPHQPIIISSFVPNILTSFYIARNHIFQLINDASLAISVVAHSGVSAGHDGNLIDVARSIGSTIILMQGFLVFECPFYADDDSY
jgi:hypothetical protein